MSRRGMAPFIVFQRKIKDFRLLWHHGTTSGVEVVGVSSCDLEQGLDVTRCHMSLCWKPDNLWLSMTFLMNCSVFRDLIFTGVIE